MDAPSPLLRLSKKLEGHRISRSRRMSSPRRSIPACRSFFRKNITPHGSGKRRTGTYRTAALSALAEKRQADSVQLVEEVSRQLAAFNYQWRPDLVRGTRICRKRNKR